MTTKEDNKYEACVKALNFELEQFWKRSLFFWGFIGAAFVALAAAKTHPFLQAAIASFGFFGSFAWTLVNRGSKFWYEDWEEKLIDAEDVVTGSLYGSPGKEKPADWKKGRLLERVGRNWLKGKRYSPSRLTIALSDYITVFWFGILGYKFASMMGIAYGVASWQWLPSKQALTITFMFASVVSALLLRGICHTSKRN
jgi:hypothetical protein